MSSVLAIGSQILTALPEASGGFELGHSSLLPGSSAIVMIGPTYSLSPSSSLSIGTSTVPGPSIFTIVGETFTAYPKGLAIDGTEVFQGNSAITISGNLISLGTSDLVIGMSTINLASVTGLGPVLSSGLAPPSATGPSSGSGPDLTSVDGHANLHSASERLRALDVTTLMITWLLTTAFPLTWLEVM